MEEKIKNIIYRDRKRKYFFKSIKEIDVFEFENNIDLPKDYKNFLFKYGDFFVEDNYEYKPLQPSPLTEDGYDAIEYFYGSNIYSNLGIYKERLNEQLLPIADQAFGDFICIGVKNEYRGKIYFWVHDLSYLMEESLFLVANSLEEFIDSFEKR